MTRFARVDKERRGAGAGKGCCDLAADMPGFPHADDYDAPAAIPQEATGIGKRGIKCTYERGQGICLKLKNPAAQGDQRVLVGARAYRVMGSHGLQYSEKRGPYLGRPEQLGGYLG